LSEGLFVLRRFYDIFSHRQAHYESIAARLPFCHVAQSNCTANELPLSISRSSCRLAHLVLVVMCFLPFMLSGCGGAALIGTAAQVGSLSASPSIVSFGSVAVGQSVNTNISLTNKGSAAVQVTQVSLTGAAFSISGVGDLPITIGASSTYNLNVGFSPQTAGTTTGQLTIVSNAASNGTMVIGLNGTGLAAGAQATLTALTCASTSLTAAGTDNCTVTLNAAAATGGFTVNLASNNSAVTVPVSVTVPAGATSANFAATVAAVNSSQTVTLTASAGGSTATVILQLAASGQTGPSAPVLTGLSCASGSMTGAGTDSCSVTLNAAAATGGFAVSITSNNSAVTVPTSVIVAAGTTTASFSATVSSVSSPQTATLTASAGGVVETFALQLSASGGGGTSPPVLSALSCANGSITGAGTVTCTVTLNAAAASGGFAVSLTSSNSAVTVPASVTVAAGATTASFAATVASVSTAQTATLTASAGGVSMTFALQLGANAPTLLINATSMAFGNVSLNTPATQTLTLTSTGSVAVSVTSALVTGAGFTVSGATFPLTLSAGQTTTLSVQFDPTVAGSATGTLTILSTSLTNPVSVITLTGTGVATAYEVNLTWNAPASSPDPVAGYAVFRSPSGASLFVPLNVAVVTQTSYTDLNVQNGLSYDYFVESVDALGVESIPSNTATVAIP
jgi:Cep192 domain 4